MCSHDCAPSAISCIDSRMGRSHRRAFEHELRAKRDIGKGESITLSYVDTLKPTPLRREQLSKDKKFWCECARCLDPTEFGSNCSALSCPQCRGPVLPEDDDDGGIWACKSKNCADYSIAASKAKDILHDMYRESTVLPSSSVKRSEQFLRERGDVLHPNNGIMVAMKARVCGMYGRCKGHEMQHLTESDLVRKQRLGLEAMEVLNLVEPGISGVKGLVLYELHLPFVMLTQMRFQLGKMGMEQAGKDFRKGLTYLKESLEILQFESEGTLQKSIYHGSKDSALKLEGFIDSVFGCDLES